MKTSELVPMDLFCQHHGVTFTFLLSLREHQLIELVEVDKTQFLTITQLPKVEKIIRLHQDLQLNTEGIDVILHLLDKINAMEGELQNLRNKLEFYG